MATIDKAIYTINKFTFLAKESLSSLKKIEGKELTSSDLPLVYFRFKYEGIQNSIRIEVKEQFRHNLLVVLRSSKSPKKELKKMDFDSSVKVYLQSSRKKKK